MSAVMQGLVHGGPPTGPGGIFSLAEPDVLEKAAREAGFTGVEVRRVPVVARYDSTDEHYESVESLAGALHLALVSASPEKRAAVRASAAAMIEPFRTESGYEVPGEALLLLAR